MHPILFEVGDFPVGTYGLMIALGIVAGIALASWLARRRGLSPEFFQDLAIVALFAGFLGARLLYVALAPKYFLQNPAEIVFSRGGFVFQGGAFVAIAVCVWYIRRRRQPLFETADIAAPALVLAHAFGRIGCFFSGCCYGLTCTPEGAHPILEKFAVKYPLLLDASGQPNQLFNYAYQEQVQNHLIQAGMPPLPIVPVQLFETAGNLLICGLLVWMWFNRKFSGQVAAVYLMLYGILRFNLEYLRADAERGLWFGGAVSTGQINSLIMLAGGIVLLLAMKGRGFEKIPAAAPEPESEPAANKKRKRSRTR